MRFASPLFRLRIVWWPLRWQPPADSDFQVVSCSSTGNLANAVAAQAAREGFDAWIFIPADLEPAKVTGTQVFGAKLVRIAGNYDQVNRLCSQIAEKFPGDL